jgi:hypothetical protein
MKTDNPYSYNLPTEPEMFFGRRNNLEIILRDLTSIPGDSIALIGGRRMGKTSLLEMLSHRLEEQAADPNQSLLLLPIFLDMISLDPEGLTSFFYTVQQSLQSLLVDKLNIQLEDTTGLAEQPTAHNFARLLERWGRVVMTEHGHPLRIILLLDECDWIAEQLWSSDLSSALRFLLVGRKTRSLLKVVMAGSYKFLTQVSQYGSPLRNILKYHTLQVLNEQDSRDLITKPTDGIPSEEIIQTVIKQSGGHPFLLQYLMFYLWDYGLENVRIDTVFDITARFLHERFDFQNWVDDLGEPGLRVYSRLAQIDEPLNEAQIRATLKPVPSNLLQVLDALCYQGLVVPTKERLGFRVTSEMFKDWFVSTVLGRLESTSLQRLYSLSRDFFAKAQFDVEELGSAEFLLHVRNQDHPQALYSPLYTRLIAGRSPRGDDFSVVYNVAKRFYGDGSNLAHRVAIVVSDERPELGARYRLYEIRQREGLAIVPLDSSLFGQIKPNRNAIDILSAEIDQATGQQNLYAISGPVSGDLSFFGRDRTLQEIIDLLDAGQPVGVFGLRKVGKTSLIQRLQGRLAHRRPIVYIDTQGTVRQQGVWPFYPTIITAFVAESQRYRPDLAIPKLHLYPEVPDTGPALAELFFRDLRLLHNTLNKPGKGERLLLVIDEIDRLIPSSKTPGYEGFTALFGQLRAANQQEHLLDFIVIGVDPTLNRVERWNDQDNELYRALSEIWVPSMAPRDVREMIESLGLQMGIHYEKNALKLLVQVGGGQPFVTRQICGLAIKNRLGQEKITVTTEQARLAIEDFIFDDPYLPELWRTRLDDSMREMLRTLAKSPVPVPRKKLLPSNQRQHAIRSLKLLEKYTLVHDKKTGYIIRWDVFHDWIRWIELGLEE